MDDVLVFTGERLIPNLNRGTAFFYEHLLRYIFACNFVKGKTVLDAGCGSGYGSLLLAKEGNAANVISVDISADAIAYSIKYYSAHNISYTVDNVESLYLIQDKSIDIVVSFEVVEHLQNQISYLKSIKRVLKPSGLAMISTPNTLTYPSGNPFHINEFTPDQFKRFLKAEFKNVKILTQSFEFIQTIKDNNGPLIKSLNGMYSYNSRTYSSKTTLNDCQYMIALVSDEKLPDLPLSSLSLSRVDHYDMTQGFNSLAANISSESKSDSNAMRLEIIELFFLITQIRSTLFYKLWRLFIEIKKVIP